jgi:tetratricopeptide (TPR) repeat protein
MREWMRVGLGVVLLVLATSATAGAQSSSSSAPGSEEQERTPTKSGKPARIAQPEAGGAAVTLETSEPLFDMAVALNACGYDADLADSNPVRQEIRNEVDAAVEGSVTAQTSRRALCDYIRDHQLSDKGRELAQYVSLALYLTPPPDLETTADQLDMPPDALQVVNILPQLRAFVKDTGLIGIWQRHRRDYNEITDMVHDPVTQMILGTNVYLRIPASGYDGRRFLILVEPMLAPTAPNARIYAADYVVVSSPTRAGKLKLDDIRHTYLHYEIEPLVYAKASSMERLAPLLKPVQDAPLEFTYKSSVVPLVTECLIKAIEARTMYVGEDKPVRPKNTAGRMDAAYDEQLAVYEHRAEATRQRQIDLDMRQGWILTDYFYAKLEAMEHDTIGLKEDIGEMVYGMDVGRQVHHAQQIAFLPEGSGELVRRTPRVPTGMMLAEKKMMEGDVDGAKDIAAKALDDPKQDHAEANYVLARVQLMEGQPEESLVTFEQVLATSKNPHTLAWAHIYLGRLYDTQPNRAKAVAEYRAAIAVQEGQPVPQDAKMAAERGLKEPFVLPKTDHVEEEPADPTGKAEKEQYGREHPELSLPVPPVLPPVTPPPAS